MSLSAVAYNMNEYCRYFYFFNVLVRKTFDNEVVICNFCLQRLETVCICFISLSYFSDNPYRALLQDNGTRLVFQCLIQRFF